MVGAVGLQGRLSLTAVGHTQRAWFIGMNPVLGDDSPADAIHDGRFHEAMGAARNFIAYS